MYWPNGVPRVYAVNGPNIVVSEDHEPLNGPSIPDQQSPVAGSNDGDKSGGREEEGENKASIDQGQSKEQQNGESISHTETPKWEDEAISGLCVSRSGHMFATITESSISLWQTRVCLGQSMRY